MEVVFLIIGIQIMNQDKIKGISNRIIIITKRMKQIIIKRH